MQTQAKTEQITKQQKRKNKKSQKHQANKGQQIDKQKQTVSAKENINGEHIMKIKNRNKKKK